MTHIICVAAQKGGCCKTATTMQLAGTLTKAGYSVFVADMDPQNTAYLWSLQSDPDKPFPAHVVSLAPRRDQFLDQLMVQAKHHEIILIDCPPAVDSPVPWTALMAADLVIIPVIPAMDNVWAAKLMEEMVLKARKTREDRGITNQLHAQYLLSQVRRGIVFEECEDALRKQAKLPVFDTRVAQRNVYPESQLFGATVHQLGKNPAIAEMDALGKEVLKVLGLKVRKLQGNKK